MGSFDFEITLGSVTSFTGSIFFGLAILGNPKSGLIPVVLPSSRLPSLDVDIKKYLDCDNCSTGSRS